MEEEVNMQNDGLDENAELSIKKGFLIEESKMHVEHGKISAYGSLWF